MIQRKELILYIEIRLLHSLIFTALQLNLFYLIYKETRVHQTKCFHKLSRTWSRNKWKGRQIIHNCPQEYRKRNLKRSDRNIQLFSKLLIPDMFPCSTTLSPDRWKRCYFENRKLIKVPCVLVVSVNDIDQIKDLMISFGNPHA